MTMCYMIINGAISVRPDRYIHEHKEDMGKLVTEMSAAGIIHPS